jgi:hypothetical protein
MTNDLFTINKKNFFDLRKEYSFSENEGSFIYRNFWPIIVLHSYDAEWIKNQLNYYKREFINENKTFDLEIFKRYNLNPLMDELNEYLDNIKKGKTKVWTERKGDYFHWFKLQFDTKSYTLLISDKNEIQLEIYFTTLLSEIIKFIENEQASFSKQIETNPVVVIKEYIPKPCFKTDSIEMITKDLNAFFEVNQHAQLKQIIETGGKANEKLLFRDNGNRLTDYFRRLYKEDTITGCNKKELINWIVKNFKYIYRESEKDFIFKTVEKIISGTGQPCKNPVI